VPVRLYANVGSEQDVDVALRQGAAGIGLFRTEFLFMERTSFPSEEDQFKVYRKVAGKMNGKCAIIRTLDVGGDKPLPYFPFPKEENPFLGWRAIRIYAEHPEILRTQLRAILRASHYGELKVMFPMILSVEGTPWLMSTLEEVKGELRDKGVPFDPSIEAGIMVETPAAVMMAAELIDLVDFFSVGSNDLTQYTLAVDRGNEKIASLYDHAHPAVLRQIKMVVDASHARGKWTGVCGELAGDERATALLLAMGVDELSVSAHKIQKIKRAILQFSRNPSENNRFM
jgi:phosphoenolpyruvate-protein phosphotransferase (PTS system enzyme I)